MDTKAAFEKWWKDEYSHLESSKYTDLVPHIKYGFFQAWQASRAAIEISPVEEYSDSPLDIIYEQLDNLSRDEVTQFGYMRGYNDCLNELSTSHGIRIKGKME